MTNGTPHLKKPCSQEWEEMRPMGKDRFCLSCQKPVIDFSDWDRDAVIGYFKQKPETCGQFTIEQLEPDLIPLSDKIEPLRKGFFATLTALTIGSTAAQEARPPFDGTEQMELVLSKHGPATYETGPGIAMKGDGPYCIKRPTMEKTPRPAKKRLFVSSRFPFVHYRRRILRGRLIRGCPSF